MSKLKHGTKVIVTRDLYYISRNAPTDELLTYKQFNEHAFRYLEYGAVLVYDAQSDIFYDNKHETRLNPDCYRVLPDRIPISSGIYPEDKTFIIGYCDDWPAMGRIIYHKSGLFFFDNVEVKLTHWSFYEPNRSM